MTYKPTRLDPTVFSLVKVPLDREQIATKGFDTFSSRIRSTKQHTKSLPKSEHHKGSNYDVEKMSIYNGVPLVQIWGMG